MRAELKLPSKKLVRREVWRKKMDNLGKKRNFEVRVGALLKFSVINGLLNQSLMILLPHTKIEKVAIAGS